MMQPRKIWTEYWRTSEMRPCEVCGLETLWRLLDMGPRHPDCALVFTGYDEVAVVVRGVEVERRGAGALSARAWPVKGADDE